MYNNKIKMKANLDKVAELELGLLEAAHHDDDRRLNELISKGGAIIIEGSKGERLLLAAAKEGNEAVVELLLGKGVDVNAQGGLYSTTLQAASHGGHEQV